MFSRAALLVLTDWDFGGEHQMVLTHTVNKVKATLERQLIPTWQIMGEEAVAKKKTFLAVVGMLLVGAVVDMEQPVSTEPRAINQMEIKEVALRSTAA